jgi:hypothetical protein
MAFMNNVLEPGSGFRVNFESAPPHSVRFCLSSERRRSGSGRGGGAQCEILP